MSANPQTLPPPPSPPEFSYAILRRDNRGVVIIREMDDYTKAVEYAKALEDLAARRMAGAVRIGGNPKYYVKLKVVNQG